MFIIFLIICAIIIYIGYHIVKLFQRIINKFSKKVSDDEPTDEFKPLNFGDAPTPKYTSTKKNTYQNKQLIKLDIEQRIRFRRSASIKIKILTISSDNKTATIEGSSGGIYTVTSNSCTCEDFKKRGLPCKHIYRFLVYTKQINPNDYELKSSEYEVYQYQLPTIDLVSTDTARYVGNNMSIQEYVYKIRTLYFPTGKLRTIRVVARENQSYLDYLPKGYSSTDVEVLGKESNFPEITENQIRYGRSLGITFPTNCCMYDASAIIDRDDKIEASKELIDFAKGRNLVFSLYMSESDLMSLCNQSFSIIEKINFFIMLIKKYNTNKWHFDEWDYYIPRSTNFSNNPKFMNSFKRIMGVQDIKSVKNTNAYKIIQEDFKVV